VGAVIFALVVLVAALGDESSTDGDSDSSSSDVANFNSPTSQPPSAGAGDEEETKERKRRRRAPARTAVVTRVVDGDTVELGGIGKVRLIGVDTPERGEECYEEATDYLEDRIGGELVRYRYQAERTDRYDRALLDIYMGGRVVSVDIAKAGWGEELTIQPNDRYAGRIAAAEERAREAPRGKWAGCLEEPEREPEPEPAPARRPPEPDEGDSEGRGGGGGGSLPDPPPDLDCSDLPGPVEVGPGDPHDLDRDGDGIGCDG
jgi:endonuclease YncB( thermonuclease family)